MLEVHATPLTLATLVLLFLLCIWWLVVEWGFSPNSAIQRLRIRKAKRAARITALKHSGRPQRTTDTAINRIDSATNPGKNSDNELSQYRNSKSEGRHAHHMLQNASPPAIDPLLSKVQNTTPNNSVEATDSISTGASDFENITTIGKHAVSRNVKKTDSNNAKSYLATANQRNDDRNNDSNADKSNQAEAKLQRQLRKSRNSASNGQRQLTPSAIQNNQSDSPNSKQGSTGASPRPALASGDNKGVIAGQSKRPEISTGAETKAQKARSLKTTVTAQTVRVDSTKSTASSQNSANPSVANATTESSKQSINQQSRKQQSRHSNKTTSSFDKNKTINDNVQDALLQTKASKTAPLNNDKKARGSAKYQTAAKAKSPSVRNEASIQIPTPRPTTSRHSQGDIKTGGDIHSLNKGRESPASQSTNAVQHQSSADSADLDRTEHHSFNAIASNASDKLSAENNSPANVRSFSHSATGRQGTSEKPKFKSTSDKPASLTELKGNSGLHKQSSIEMASERRIESLQSTLNNLQQLPTMATSTSSAVQQQHSRPTLMSKVRILDRPKS